VLYVIHGTDIETARAKAHGLFEALKGKKPDASAGTLAAEQVTLERLDELTQSQGLFENRQIIFMDRTLENKDVREVILERIDELGESPNIFIFFEGKLTKEILKKLEKRAEKIQEYAADDAPKAKQDGGFFALADALGSRDKKGLWVLFREAMDRDAAPEEIHGILFWQAKSLALAARTRDAAEAGLNPFVYGKAKRYVSNFRVGEIDALVSRLVHIYHHSHRGEGDFELALEKMILDL
jgi:DNA polymerase III delta subunit